MEIQQEKIYLLDTHMQKTFAGPETHACKILMVPQVKCAVQVQDNIILLLTLHDVPGGNSVCFM